MSVYKKLTPKQQRFVDEYMIDMNATQSYRRAGYSAKSDRTAGVEGHKLLNKPKIQEAIQERRDAQQKRTEVTADKVINQLAKIAFADIKDFVTWDKEGNVILKDADKVDGTLVNEISSDPGEWGNKFKFKRNDQLKALELLGKHMKLFTDKVEQETTGEIKVNFAIPRPTYEKKG